MKSEDSPLPRLGPTPSRGGPRKTHAGQAVFGVQNDSKV